MSLGLLDTEYTELAAQARTPATSVHAATPISSMLRRVLQHRLEHTASLRNGGSLVSRLDYNYQGNFWRSTSRFVRRTAIQSIPDGFDESGDWGILNMRFSYEPADAN